MNGLILCRIGNDQAKRCLYTTRFPLNIFAGQRPAKTNNLILPYQVNIEYKNGLPRNITIICTSITKRRW